MQKTTKKVELQRAFLRQEYQNENKNENWKEENVENKGKHNEENLIG